METIKNVIQVKSTSGQSNGDSSNPSLINGLRIPIDYHIKKQWMWARISLDVPYLRAEEFKNKSKEILVTFGIHINGAKSAQSASYHVLNESYKWSFAHLDLVYKFRGPITIEAKWKSQGGISKMRYQSTLSVILFEDKDILSRV